MRLRELTEVDSTRTSIHGLPIFRGRLIRRISSYPDQAYIEFFDPVSGETFRHGWYLTDGYDVLTHRGSHVAGHYRDGYYVGVDPQATHAVELTPKELRDVGRIHE